jgi:hypothetical protein
MKSNKTEVKQSVCEFCEHYQETVRGKECNQAHYSYPNDGYGPFFERAGCVHDERLDFPKSKFKPITEGKLKRHEEMIEQLREMLKASKKEADTLRDRLTRI